MSDGSPIAATLGDAGRRARWFRLREASVWRGRSATVSATENRIVFKTRENAFAPPQPRDARLRRSTGRGDESQGLIYSWCTRGAQHAR
jgi:hypothetical protein